MKIGKLPNDLLEKIIFNNIENKREEILIGASMGEDNAIVDFGDEVCILSTDPITGTTKGIGKLAINISCNDVASSGAEPIGVLLTLLAPPSITEKDIEDIMKEASDASVELNVQIMGGHTEITDAVNRVVISTTVIGKQKKEDMLDAKNVKVGDKILLTKHIGIEGTSIIAEELEDILSEKMDMEKIQEAKEMSSLLSVVKEGVIAGKAGAKYMHDITEGGVLGALWEAAKAIDKGIIIYKDNIPMKGVTEEISNILNIDPYRLISSGSMIIIADSQAVNKVEKELKEENIPVRVIGEVTDQGIMIEKENSLEEIAPPSSDELYRALSMK